MQRVEPAARLVDGLADKVGGEVFFKFVTVFKWIMQLRVGHRARLKPHIHGVGEAVVGASVFLKRNLVNVGAVELEPTQVLTRKLLEFSYAAHTNGVLPVF